MGADSRMENSSDGGGLRAVHSRRDVSYLCGGRPADGDYLRHFFRPVSGAGPVPRSVRGGGDSLDLVLHRPDWLAGICLSCPRHADGGYRRLGPETTQRVNQFPFRGGADYFTLAAPTALPGRVSTFIFRCPVHHSHCSRAPSIDGTPGGGRSVATPAIATELAGGPADANSVYRRYLHYVAGGLDRLSAAGRVLLSYLHACQHARQLGRRASVRPRAGQQPVEPPSGGLVPLRGTIIQPRRLVLNGMYPRNEFLVRQLAARVLLRARAQPLHQHALPCAAVDDPDWLALQERTARLENWRVGVGAADLVLGILAGAIRHAADHPALARRLGNILRRAGHKERFAY